MLCEGAREGIGGVGTGVDTGEAVDAGAGAEIGAGVGTGAGEGGATVVGDEALAVERMEKKVDSHRTGLPVLGLSTLRCSIFGISIFGLSIFGLLCSLTTLFDREDLKKFVKWLGETVGECGDEATDEASVTDPVESPDDLLPTDSSEELSEDVEDADAFRSESTFRDAMSGAL